MTPPAQAYYLGMLHYVRSLYQPGVNILSALQDLAQVVADYEAALSGAAHSKVKLNLGSADVILKGFINVDIVPAPGVEVVDLTKPWPWLDNSVDYVRASHLIEHLPDKILTMNELWRVLKPGAKVDIEVPTTDGSGAWQDPTHVSFWNRRSFLYYEAGSPYRELAVKQYQVKAEFRTVRERLTHTLDGPILSITLEAIKQATSGISTQDPMKRANLGKASLVEVTRLVYLYLLKRTLTRYPLTPVERMMLWWLRDMEPALTNRIIQWATVGFHAKTSTFNPLLRAVGMDWPDDGETMIGLSRLDNLEQCITSLLKRNIPGDLIETGVWRGGASIFMRAVLKAYDDKDRTVWLADSFCGLPKPDADSYPLDRDDDLWKFPELAVSLDNVKANFESYGLLDEQVRFLPGWFRDTLPAAPVERLSLLRLDGDMYESTILALRSLYDKVSVGGFVVIDDYYFPSCRQAVHDFRAEEGIVEPLRPIDWTGVYWQVNASVSVKTKRGSRELSPAA